MHGIIIQEVYMKNAAFVNVNGQIFYQLHRGYELYLCEEATMKDMTASKLILLADIVVHEHQCAGDKVLH